MNATYIRDAIDSSLYLGGTTLSNMHLDTNLLSSYVTKWHTAKAHVSGYILSVWALPPAFKSSNHLASSSDSAYVAYLTAILRYLNTSTAGAPLAVSIGNEPDVSAYTMYSDSQWQNIVEMTRGSLDFLSLSVPLFGPEPSAEDKFAGFLGGSVAVFDTLDRDYLSRNAVGAFATHTYGQCDWETVKSFVTSHTKDAWVTEFSKPLLQGSSDIAYALDGMSAMGANLVLVPNNYWAWWYGWAVQNGTDSTKDYGALLDGDATHSTVQLYSKRYFLFQNLWGLVTGGSWYLQTVASTNDTQLRIDSTGTQTMCQPRVDFYGFINSAGNQNVVVVSNWTGNTKYITLNGLPTGETKQKAYRADTTTTTGLSAEDSSTVWVPSGQTTARTVLYAPPRSVIIAHMY